MKLILLNIVVTVVCCVSLMLHIEKHSVHPKYGNYKKISSFGEKCEPWDDCN
jgi:hypothetical protein